MKNVLRGVASLFCMVLIFMFPAAAFGVTCSGQNCEFSDGAWSLYAQGNFDLEQQPQFARYTHEGAVSLGHRDVSGGIEITHSYQEIYTAVSSGTTASNPPAAGDHAYLRGYDPVTHSGVNLQFPGFDVTASAVQIDFSDQHNADIHLSGNIRINNNNIFRMSGGLTIRVQVNDGDNRFSPSITRFCIGSCNVAETGATSCPGDPGHPLMVGNLAFDASQVALGSSGLELAGDIYIRHHTDRSANNRIKLPLTNLAIDAVMAGTIPIYGGTLTFPGFTAKADDIHFYDANKRTVTLAGNLQINSLSLPGWSAEIDLVDRTPTKVSVADQDAARGSALFGMIALYRDWHFVFDGASLRLSSDVDPATGGAFGFRIDTHNANAWYQDRNDTIANIPGGGALNPDQIRIDPVPSLTLSQPMYRVVRSLDSGTPFAVQDQGTGLPVLLISEANQQFAKNAAAAIEHIRGSRAFLELGGLIGNYPHTGMRLEGDDFTIATSGADGQEYLFVQVEVTDGRDVEFSNGTLSRLTGFKVGKYVFDAASSPGFDVTAGGLQWWFWNNGYVGSLYAHDLYGPLNNWPTISYAHADLHLDGAILLQPPVTLAFYDGSPPATFQNTATLDPAHKTLTIHPDDLTLITINQGGDTTVLECPSGLTATMTADQPVTEGVFTGSFGLTGGKHEFSWQNQRFSFFGWGTYNFQHQYISAISGISGYGDGYYGALGKPLVFLGEIGLLSDGFRNSFYTYAASDRSAMTLTGGPSDYHFVHPPPAAAADDFTFKNVIMSVDVAANRIAAVSSPGGNPAVTYTDPHGVTFTLAPAPGHAATIAMAGSDTHKIVMTGDLLVIEDSAGGWYEISGSLTVDYERRLITSIEPDPGTGLVISRHAAIFGDTFTAHTDFEGLTLSGRIQVGPADVQNRCGDDGRTDKVICLGWEGDITFDFDTNQVKGISVDGAFKVPVNPGNPGEGWYGFEPFNHPAPVAGSTFVKGTLGNGIQVVVDLNRKCVVAAAPAGKEQFVWAAGGTCLEYDYGNELFTTLGAYVLGTGDQVPANIDYRPHPPATTIPVTGGSGSQAQVGSTGAEVQTDYIRFGRNMVIGVNYNGSKGGSIQTKTDPANGNVYHYVTRPFIWVVRDNAYEDPSAAGDPVGRPAGEPILYYEGSINVGKEDSLISACDAEDYYDHYVYARQVKAKVEGGGIPAKDQRLSNEYFIITSNGWRDQQNLTENSLVFIGGDSWEYGTVLPDIGFPSIFMALSRQDLLPHSNLDLIGMGVWDGPNAPGANPALNAKVALNQGLHTYRFKLYHDRVTTQSSFAKIGLGALGGAPGLSLGLEALAKMGGLDIEADPTIVLSQNAGESSARMHFGVIDITEKLPALKSMSWFQKLFGAAVKSVSSGGTPDVMRFDCDFVTDTFGFELRVDPGWLELGGFSKAAPIACDQPGGAEDEKTKVYFTGAIQIGNDGPHLDMLSVDVRREKPFFIVPEEPAGLGINQLQLTVDHISAFENDPDGRLSVTLDAFAPARDLEGLLCEIQAITGRDLLSAEGSVNIQLSRNGYFSLVVSGDGKLLNFIPIAELTAGLEITNSTADLWIEGDYNFMAIFNGSLQGHLTQTWSPPGFSMGLGGELGLAIPHGIPIVGGRHFGGLSAGMDMSAGSGGLSADVHAGISVHILFVHIDFGVGLELFPHTHFYATRSGETPAEAFTYYMGETTPVAIAPDKRRSPDAPVAVALGAGHATPMLALTGTDAAPEFDVVYPDGTRYRFEECWQGAPEDTPYPDTIFFLVDEDTRTTYAALNHPAAGTYLLVPGGGHAGALSAFILDPATPVGGALTGTGSPRGLRSGGDTLELTLEGVNDAQVTLYATVKKIVNTGHPISQTYHGLASGTHELAVDPTSDRLHSGWFYVYAKVRDKYRMPRYVWFDDMVKVTNPSAPPVPENVTAAERGGDLVIDWDEYGAGEAISYTVHVFEAGETDLSHGIFHPADSTEFVATGLAPETDYEIVVAAKNELGVAAYSRPLAVTTSAAPGFVGAPDLEVDVAGTRELTGTGETLTIRVCNTGTADAESAEVHIFYGHAQPRSMIADLPLGPVAAGQCGEVEVSVTEDQLAHFRALAEDSDGTERVVVSVDNVVPVEHAGQGNFKSISFSETIPFTVDPGDGPDVDETPDVDDAKGGGSGCFIGALCNNCFEF